jgi:glycosyltransferase involved in cell wall biosynthesis
MKETEKIAIIIPCYNEENRIPHNEFSQFAQENKNVHFYFVNDGSKDDTWKIIAKVSNAIPDRLFAIDLKKNVGKAEAVRQGILKGLERDYIFIGYWDADLSTPLGAIQKFASLLVENPKKIAVFGARVKLLGRKIIRKEMRHYIGRIFASFASLVLGVDVYDTQCGAKLFVVNEAVKRIFDHPFNVSWIFDVELLARLKILIKSQKIEDVVIEYPLDQWIHQPGSKIGILTMFKAMYDLCKLFSLLRMPVFERRYKMRLKSLS